MRTIVQIGSCYGDIDGADPIINSISNEDLVVLVEPIEHIFNRLKANYENKYPNNNFIFVNKAISSYIGKISLYTPKKEELNSIKRENDMWKFGVSSVNKDHPTNHWGQVKTVEEIKVNCVTLEQLFIDLNISEIDLLHIDTEGHDIEILNSYNYKIKPKKIIFENAHTDGTRKRSGNYKKFIEFISKKGYFVEKEDDCDTYLTLKQ